jgi:hypothetical protein
MLLLCAVADILVNAVLLICIALLCALCCVAPCFGLWLKLAVLLLCIELLYCPMFWIMVLILLCFFYLLGYCVHCDLLCVNAMHAMLYVAQSIYIADLTSAASSGKHQGR